MNILSLGARFFLNDFYILFVHIVKPFYHELNDLKLNFILNAQFKGLQ